MKKIIIPLIALFFLIGFTRTVNATGEASTYFQIFVPPNNDPVGRDVCLIVTAIYDSTSFEIIDDNMDGDDDDSVSGILMAGQSYILYIREGGINDDAPHSGEGNSKQDGDFFIVSADKLILTSQSTKSDWQHDWVPATNQSSKGQRFIIYSPPTSFSNRDLNVFAWENGTEITVRKISWANQTSSGYTNVEQDGGEIILQKSINVGEDIIFYNQEGRDIMETGATYMIESNKDITVQYGALWGNARDGGGYVPSDNGSSSGELFYFAVPYQASREQEIRIVSWDNNNIVSLDKFQNGNWVSVESWNLDALEPGDWISYSGNINSVFRVSCSSGKSVSVFEANWLETGSPGTSDVASMLSASNGSTAGTEFLTYMAPPGKENNVTDPFTGQKFNKGSHLFIFSRTGANVTVKDMGTNGDVINRSYTIDAGMYVDCYLDLAEWKSIYNGDGNPGSGPERPYLIVNSDEPVSVFNTNFNDNWMSYFGSSQSQDISVNTNLDATEAIPGDTLLIVGEIEVANQMTNTNIEVKIGDGATAISSTLNTNGFGIDGVIEVDSLSGNTTINFANEPDLQSNSTYVVNTEMVINVQNHDESLVEENTIVPVEVIVSGDVGGVYQQNASTDGVMNASNNHSNLMYSDLSSDKLPDDLSSNWSVSFCDYNNDGHDDVFITTYDENIPNLLYKNDGNGNMQKVFMGDITSDKASSVAASWGDVNNDGYADLFVANNIGGGNFFYINNSGTSFTKITDSPIVNSGVYCHSASWSDFDNDGLLDLFVAEYMPTKNNLLFKNLGNGEFEKTEGNAISLGTSFSIGAAWCDYNNDGYPDLFVPNTNGEANYLYKNLGSGDFELQDTNVIPDSESNSVGCSWGDVNNDGYMDLFIVNAGNQNNELLINNNGENFYLSNDNVIGTSNGHSHGSGFGDFDNDGDIDLYVTNDQDKSKFLFLNDGEGSFTKDVQEVVIAAQGNTFANAISDIDRDGDLDILTVCHNEEANKLFVHNGTENNWIELVLHGTVSNKQAIGAVVKVRVNGDSQWQYRQLTSQTGGGAGSQNSFRQHFGLGEITLIDEITVSWPSGYITTLNNVEVNQILTISEGLGVTVEGRVFTDGNGDGIYNNGETTVSGVKVVIDPGNHIVFTNSVGKYSANLVPGSYDISIETPDLYSLQSPASSYDLNLTQGQNQLDKDFILSAIVDKADLTVDLSTTMLRRGFKNDYTLVVENIGTVSSGYCELDLALPEHIIPLYSDVEWQSETNGEINWVLDPIHPGEQVVLILTDSVSIESELGQIKEVSLSVSTTIDEVNYTNNQKSDFNEIVGSVDPNDKLVYPSDKIVKGMDLKYKIRFQNVGNFPAEHVKIVDTLSNLLDVSSLASITASHDYEFRIEEERILIWEFPQIWLADSVHNEPESHGFVQFTIRPVEELSYGVDIKNKATIIFDYFQYTPTNTVSNTYESVFVRNPDTKLVIYPNPTSGYVQMEFEVDADTEVSVMLSTLTGQNVLETSYNSRVGWNQVSQDYSNLNPGSYIVSVKGNEFNYQKIVVINK